MINYKSTYDDLYRAATQPFDFEPYSTPKITFDHLGAKNP